jgi:hypothetical protein
MATCAMAFRLLRLHGYDVSSGKQKTPPSPAWFRLKFLAFGSESPAG